MTDALADAIAREEHRQGLPIGDEVGHCEACNDETLRRAHAELVANCSHDDWVDITTLGELPGSSRICTACGSREQR